MAPKKLIPPERLAEARRLYEQTLAPVDDIVALLDVSHSLFYRIVKEGGWRGRRAHVGTFEFARALTGTGLATFVPEPAEQPRAEMVAGFDPVSAQRRAALAQRIMGAVERELDAVGRVLDRVAPADQIEAEHGARTLASISRTLREITALNQSDQVAPTDDTDDDSVPVDIDALRSELARRLHALIEARSNPESASAERILAGHERD